MDYVKLSKEEYETIIGVLLSVRSYLTTEEKEALNKITSTDIFIKEF